MRFQVECFENVDAFGVNRTKWLFAKNEYDRDEDKSEAVEAFRTNAFRRVANLTVEANTAQGAADAAFEIANAPWEPEDLEGVRWPHQSVRSMSSGDVVLVHTPDGPVAYGCLFIGWLRLPQLPESIVAALA